MNRYTPKPGAYGAFKMLADECGEWVRLSDVRQTLGIKPGDSLNALDVYCCIECLGLFCESDSPSETPSDSDNARYCEECADECKSAAEESSHEYWNRYIAGDR